MMLQYKTERLPLNYLMLGFTLLVVGCVTVFNKDYEGALAFLLAIPLLFTRSGLEVDCGSRQIRKYTGLFSWRAGKWTDIKGAKHLQIARTRQAQGMWVASISRTEQKMVYKLLVMMPHSRVELLSGNLEEIEPMAKQIASGLDMELKYPKP